MNQTMGCGPFQLKVTQREEKEGYLVQTMNFKYAVEVSFALFTKMPSAEVVAI